MRKLARNAYFPGEAACHHTTGVLASEELEGDDVAVTPVSGAIDMRHPTLAKLRLDLVSVRGDTRMLARVGHEAPMGRCA